LIFLHFGFKLSRTFGGAPEFSKPNFLSKSLLQNRVFSRIFEGLKTCETLRKTCLLSLLADQQEKPCL